jgi:hypothetical protein
LTSLPPFPISRCAGERESTAGEDQAFLGLNIMRVQQLSGSFALCVEDGGMEDLKARKVYQILPAREAAREGYIRVVDESGENYIYPSELFVLVRLPAAVVRRLRGSARSDQRALAVPIGASGK